MSVINQRSTYTRSFIMVESADHISPLIGATPAVILSKAGAPFVRAEGVVSEVGNGWYSIALTANDTDTVGELAYHVTASLGDDSDFADQVLASAPSPVPPPAPIPVSGPQPNLYSFILFIRNVMGISTVVLPDTSLVISMAFAVALGIVNKALKCVPVPDYDAAGVMLNSGGLTIYDLAVYNLAGSNLLAYAQDLPDAATVQGSNPPTPFFAWTRKQWNINGFVSGVVQASSDETTSVSLVVQDAAKSFTLANLAQLKDPYGRAYLAFAQSAGPETWGIS